MTNPRKDAEKALSEIEALLGETTEGAAALHVLRDLTETAAPGDAAYCLTRIALAIEVAQQRHGMDQWNRGYHAGSLEPQQSVIDDALCRDDAERVHEHAQDADDDELNDDMDGDHASALASVYGEND